MVLLKVLPDSIIATLWHHTRYCNISKDQLLRGSDSFRGSKSLHIARDQVLARDLYIYILLRDRVLVKELGPCPYNRFCGP